MRNQRSMGGMFGLTIFAVLLAGPLFPQASKATGGCLVASDGKGTLELRWAPAQGQWPLGGWQIQDGRGNVLMAKVAVGEEKYLAGLPSQDIENIRTLAKALPPFKSSAEKSLFFSLQVLRAYSDPAYARALGLARTIEKVAGGSQTYQVVALDAAGRPTGPILKSGPIDAAIATPFPQPPAGLKGESQKTGVVLYWSAPSENPSAPIIGYRIERTDASGHVATANDRLVLLNKAGGAGRPAFTDALAPAEEDLAYRVFTLDVFGRSGVPAEMKIHHADWKALDPPTSVKAEGKKGKVALTWKPNASPRTQAVYVERAFSAKGPFLPITPKGLAASRATYEDSDVKGGVSYLYRLRSAGSGGAMGEPSVPTSALALSVFPPAQPRGLKADIGRTRVRLSWAKDESPIVGYIVEKKAANGDWLRLNENMDQAALFDVPLGEETSGTFLYRVRSIAFDNQESAPSAPLEVRIPVKGLPPAPLIVGVETRDGKAVVRFKPGLPENRSAQFVVLRGGSAADKGIVLGRPLPASAREYTDTFVQPGLDYWYRVVTFDGRGNRSLPSEPVLVTVGTPSIPTPAAPKVALLNEPFVQVRISFAAPPSGLEAVSERKLEAETLWLRLPGSTDKSEMVDPDPPKIGRISYRIIYRAANGMTGPPSPAAVIDR